MSRFWSKLVQDLVPYVPGEQPALTNLVKLNTNENPYGPSDAVLAAIAEASDERLRLYPDPESTALREAIAAYHRIEPGQVFVGNGSDEVLAHIFHGFFQQPDPLWFPDITYSFYKVYCGLYRVAYRTLPLDDEFGIDLEAFPEDAGAIIFPNPNAPTGRALDLERIRSLLRRLPDTLVVVDEAYVDFGAESAISLVGEHDNLLVTQTLSKSRSLAGLRIGFAVGQAPLVEGLNRVKNSFNSYPLDRVAQAAAVASFADEEAFQSARLRVMESREQLAAQLAQRGFQVLPSCANFLFARHQTEAGAGLAAALRRHGVIVRHFSQPARIADFLRITVGTPEQNQALLTALDAEL